MRSVACLLSGPILILCLAGCGLTDDPPVDPPANPVTDDTVVFTARLNGNPWIAEAPRASLSRGADLTVLAVDPDETRYPYEQGLFFIVPIEGVGSYSLNRSTRMDNPGTPEEVFHLYGAILQEAYGDQVNSEYHATQDPANRLVVTRYDGVNGYVEGTFAATLVVDLSSESRELPDTLRFTDGRFRVRVEDLRGG